MSDFPYAYYSRALATPGQRDRFARLARLGHAPSAEHLYDIVARGLRQSGRGA